MSYIGATPLIGNYQKCDAITTSATDTFNLLVGGVAVSPATPQNCVVSLNGVIQAPTTAYTVSGSTIVFDSALTTSDVIDFIIILGNVLDLGTPSDDTVTAAKLNDTAISGQTALGAEPADTDEFLVSDAGVLKRMDYSYIKAGGAWTYLNTTTISSDATVDIETSIDSTYPLYAFVFDTVKTADDNRALYMRVKQSGSYQTGSSYQFHTMKSDSNTSAWDATNTNGTTGTYIGITAQSVGNAATESMNGIFYLPTPSSTAVYKIAQWKFTGMNSSGYYMLNQGYGGYDNTAAVTGLQIYASIGDMASGSIYLYGIKNS